MYDTIIIGAGASGLMAAIVSARKGEKVLLIEKMNQAGRKLRITGKGRCNITNTLALKDFLKHCGSEPRFLYPAFNLFFNKELINFFEDLGLKTIEERGGRIFPQSQKAQDVFLAMINELEDLDCHILKNTEVIQIITEENQAKGVVTKTLCHTNKPIIKTYYSNKIILAAGGESYPQTGSCGDGIKLAKELGHSIIPTIPALVGLELEGYAPKTYPQIIDFTIRNAKAIIKNKNDKKLYEEFGELIFRDDAIEGAIILTLSRKIGYELQKGEELFLELDFKPAIEEKELDKRIIQELNQRGQEPLQSSLRAFLPKELIDFALSKTELDRYKSSSQLSSIERKLILNFLKHSKFKIISTLDFDRAVITQGGVSLKGINPKTLESKLINGLYFAGEVMDLDADTGGFNLQIAFSTGFLAAQNKKQT